MYVYADKEQSMLVNIIGGRKLKMSSLSVTLVDKHGRLLKKLCYMVVEIKYGLKLKVAFIPPNTEYRVRVTGRFRIIMSQLLIF